MHSRPCPWPAPCAPGRRITASASRATAARSMAPSRPPSPSRREGRHDAPFHETSESRHGTQERRRARAAGVALEATHAFPASSRSAASRRADPRRRHHPGDPLPPALAPPQPAQAPRHRQAHWSIENHLHWTLDVVFDEDDARSRKNYAPKTSPSPTPRLNILNAHPDKRSTASKMRQAKWKQTYFLSLFAHLQ